MRALVLVGLLAACDHDTRSEACATVRKVLDRHSAHGHDGTPRRYYDYQPDKAQAFDPDVTRDLQQQRYADPDVAAAVQAIADTGWTVYTPYSTEHTDSLGRLRDLCHIRALQISAGP